MIKQWAKNGDFKQEIQFQDDIKPKFKTRGISVNNVKEIRKIVTDCNLTVNRLSHGNHLQQGHTIETVMGSSKSANNLLNIQVKPKEPI